ncbi:MAG: hypothetical protein ACE14M_05100 [Terriglobales bacterium]
MNPHDMTTAELRAAITRKEETVHTPSAEEAALMRACADFKEMCPDFIPSATNISALLQHAAIWNRDGSVGRIPDGEALRDAFALARYRGEYSEVSAPPAPTADPYNCPLDALGSAVRQDQPIAADAAYDKPLHELAAELRGETIEAPAPEYTATAAELRAELEKHDEA